jgi:L-lactate dehydrogenase complex protein LldG
MVGTPMSSDVDRASILDRIGKALANGPAVAQPALDDHGDESVGADRLALAQQFARELELVGGEARFVASEDDVAGAIAAFVGERGLGAASLDFATADYALLRAEALLADTGSAIVIERSADRRLAPYLPRTCIIVADAGVLHASLSVAALEAVHAAARRGDRGEAVIITGPSRTADIEKTLVLGAHGPKTLVVFIVGVLDTRARI